VKDEPKVKARVVKDIVVKADESEWVEVDVNK